jgi:dolichyl-phosphate beta-glucosyltransferase
MSKTTVVVPCYNEEKRLNTDSFRKTAAKFPDLSFLFVDDGSTDGTGDLLSSLCNGHERFDFHTLPANFGKAEAVRLGILKALESDPVYLAMWDADLATPLDEISCFCEVLDSRPEVLMVLGARVKLMGRSIERPGTRHYMGRFAATLISFVLQLEVYDTQCGAKMFRANDITRSLFEEPFISTWIFDVEIIARLLAIPEENLASQHECTIYELPLNEWRHMGASKVKGQDYAKALWDLYRIYSRYLYPLRNNLKNGVKS